jgi:hypothetical protein
MTVFFKDSETGTFYIRLQILSNTKISEIFFFDLIFPSRNSFIGSKSSNPFDLPVEELGEKSQHFTALTASTNSLHCKPLKEN